MYNGRLVLAVPLRLQHELHTYQTLLQATVCLLISSFVMFCRVDASGRRARVDAGAVDLGEVQSASNHQGFTTAEPTHQPMPLQSAGRLTHLGTSLLHDAYNRVPFGMSWRHQAV